MAWGGGMVRDMVWDIDWSADWYNTVDPKVSGPNAYDSGHLDVW